MVYDCVTVFTSLFRDVIPSPHPCSVWQMVLLTLTLIRHLMYSIFFSFPAFHCVLLPLKQQELTTIHKNRRNANAMDPLSSPLPKQTEIKWSSGNISETSIEWWTTFWWCVCFQNREMYGASRLQFLVSASRFLNQAKQPTSFPEESLCVHHKVYFANSILESDWDSLPWSWWHWRRWSSCSWRSQEDWSISL